MATRTNIVIELGSSRLYLYRHWDGYPAETGGDLVNKLSASGRNPTKFLASLMAEMDEATSYRAASHVYEVTSDLHGDIEWIYVVKFYDSAGFGVAMRPVRNGANEDAVLVEALKDLGSLDRFATQVNIDRKEINQRMVARGMDTTPYAMVVAP
jgi:hypothetical protein